MKCLVHISWCTCAYISTGQIPRSEILLKISKSNVNLKNHSLLTNFLMGLACGVLKIMLIRMNKLGIYQYYLITTPTKNKTKQDREEVAELTRELRLTLLERVTLSWHCHLHCSQKGIWRSFCEYTATKKMSTVIELPMTWDILNQLSKVPVLTTDDLSLQIFFFGCVGSSLLHTGFL